MMTSVSPRPLHGIPLTGPTGLQLLISSNPPRLLDVDRGTSRTIAGLPTAESRLFWVQAVGVDAVISPTSEVFVLRRGTTAATPIGQGWDVAASRDGRGVWLLQYADTTRCTLREIGSTAGHAARPV